MKLHVAPIAASLLVIQAALADPIALPFKATFDAWLKAMKTNSLVPKVKLRVQALAPDQVNPEPPDCHRSSIEIT